MKKAKFPFEGKKYEMYYDCPDEEINDQLQEIFSEQDYKLAKRGKDLVVLDVGANVGMFSLYIKDYARKIWAVEPSRRIFECLKENTKDWDNIEVFNVGFWNRKGKQGLYGKEGQTPQTMMLQEQEFGELADVVTIEEFMNENNIDHVDVMKIDVEGAEYIILPDQTFKNVADRIDFIIGEGHYLERMIPDHVIEILKQTGFKAKFIPFNNQYVWLDYQNPYTGQKERFTVKKPTIFTAERI